MAHDPNQLANSDDQLRLTRDYLEALNAPDAMLNYLAPYSAGDIAHVYTGQGPHEAYNGSGGQAEDGSESIVTIDLMVGTSKPIGEIIGERRYDDQAPEVKVQWRSNEYPRKPGNSFAVERNEVEQIDEKTFVERRYRGVSGMGQFDGELVGVDLMVESGEFHPESAYPGRKEYRIYQFYKQKGGEWMRFSFGNVSGTQLLNGLQELRAMDLAHIRGSSNPASPMLLEAAPTDVTGIGDELLAVTPSKEDQFSEAERAAAAHPEIMERIRTATITVADQTIESLSEPEMVEEALGFFIDGVLKYPDKIRLLGNSAAVIDPNKRFTLAQVLEQAGAAEFQRWYASRFQGEDKALAAATMERIVSLNMMNFAEAWLRYSKGTFEAPDYTALETDIQAVQRGQSVDYSRYPLTPKIVHGLESAAVGIFIEDYLLDHRAER